MTLDPKIYRRAAEKVTDPSCEWGVCGVICNEVASFKAKELAIFKEIFTPEFYGYLPLYWLGPLDDTHKLDRSLALLFMEQIAKDLNEEKR